MRFVLLRHGEAENTRVRRLSGHGDFALTPLGRAQAAAAGRRIGTLGLASVRLVTSPVARASETADIVAASLQVMPEPAPAFAEVDFGEWEGCTGQEIDTRWPGPAAAYELDRLEASIPGGERVRDAVARMLEGWRSVSAAARADGVEVLVVVTHATPIQAIVSDTVRSAPRDMHRMYMNVGSVTTGLFGDDGAALLLTLNDCAHLGRSMLNDFDASRAVL